MEHLILPHKTPSKAVGEALNLINEERDTKQYGLFSRYEALNIAMGKYFRFGEVNLWAGLSGHGKSYIMNILTDDFQDYKAGINKNIDFIPIVFNFCFEMSAFTEILRGIASDMGVSYSYLLSSQYDKKNKNYNQLSNEELVKVKQYLDFYKRKSILFFETPGNTKRIYNTVAYYVNHYNKLGKKNNVKYRFIVNIDHTLLIDKLDEKSTLDLMANVGKIAILMKKDFYAMVNLLGQLNNNIEDVRRIITKSLHYPTKSDIYAQGQLYNACENVFVIHQPSQLKITKYGVANRDTTNLIHLLKLKARHGKVGSIWLKNDLSNGKIIEFPKELQGLEELEKNDANIKDI